MEATAEKTVADRAREHREATASSRAENRDRRRKLIQAAARKFLKDRGTKFSIEEVARECRISVGGIYLYFESKDDLLGSLLEDLRVPEGAKTGRLFMGNYFEVLLRLASCDTQKLSSETGALVKELLPEFSEGLRNELGDELVKRAVR